MGSVTFPSPFRPVTALGRPGLPFPSLSVLGIQILGSVVLIAILSTLSRVVIYCFLDRSVFPLGAGIVCFVYP